MFFRFIRCLFLLKNPASTLSAEYDLGHYYPDNGKLSDTKGYKHRRAEYDLSIIIPVYNVERYIEECLNSIISQITNYKYEVILVDDGSKDNTANLIKPYLADNIKLISQKNFGQSIARNTALYESSGKYIMFVDSDDVLLPNAIQGLMDAAKNNNADISEGSYVWFYDKITTEMIDESKAKSRIETYECNPKYILSCAGYSWAKVYRRELFETLRFLKRYIFDDVITKFILRRKANKVVFTGAPVYGYRYNNLSCSHSNNPLKKLDSVWVYPKIIDLCEQGKVPFDNIFYLLSLNHIGLLNYITVRNHTFDIKISCFCEMRNQLSSIQQCRPKMMPVFFKVLEKAIVDNNFEAWLYIADTIQKYKLLKKWREIN